MKISKEKLAKLSKEQKIELIEAIKEKRKRQLIARPVFKPNAGQLPVIVSKASKRMVISGNGAGKTGCAVNEALWAANGYNPVTEEHTAVPAKIIVVLDSPEKVADVWLPELKKWAVIPDDSVHKRGKPYITEITFNNGSSLRFMFALQEPMAFESLETDFVVIDEPVVRSIWVALLRSGRKKNRQARFLMIATPIAQPWIKDYYAEWQKGNYPDTEFFKMSSHVNAANLSEGYIDAYTAHLTEREKRTRIYGDFFNNEGMALSGLFKRERHVIPASEIPQEYKQSWPHVIAFDPHSNKPTHGCLMAVGPDNVKYYVAEFSKKIVARELANWLKANWLMEYRVVDIISDSSGQADFSGGEAFKSFIEVLNECGVRVRGTSYAEKGDAEFLTRIQEALYIPPEGEPKIKFLMGCTGIIRDIENVQWKAQKGTEEYQPKLEIGNKDYLACLKYALAANLTFDNSRRKVIRPAKPSPWSGKSTQASGGERVGYMERAWERNRKRDDDDDW